MRNPIITQLRRIRDAHAKRHNFKVDAIARELMELEPWMEKRAYTLHREKMVPISTFRAQKGATGRGRGSKKNRS